MHGPNMRETFPPMTLTYAKLLKLARQKLAREMDLSPSDFRAIAVKEPTTPSRPVKPPDAGDDWTPPVPVEPAQMRFDAGHASVLVRPNKALQPGQVEFR